MATKKPDTPIINPFSNEFLEVWEGWKAFKKQQFRFTYKPIGEQDAIDHLYELSGGNEKMAALIIKQSRVNGWRGLFDLKTSYNEINKGFTQKPRPSGDVSPGGFGQL